LEQKVDQLASEKRRLQLKFAKARVMITKIIVDVEKELGPMSAKDKREYWEELEAANPVELSPNVTEPLLTELNGLVYPSNWGGTAKYNLTKLTMTKKTCTTLYGFPVEFEWLQFLITHVFFPGMSADRSSREVTSLFCGRVSEKEMVRLHRSWLGIFPEGYGRLVDRGFTFCTPFYPNLNQAFSPAHVNRKTGDLTHRQVIDARRQSADRYTCEVVYARVKQFRILTGRCPVSRLQFLPAAWLVSHMAANFYKPLREPDCMSEWSDAKLQAAYL